jgi:hypothetical protein
MKCVLTELLVINTLLLIREVPGSNLGLETSYPDRFSSVPPGKCWDSTLN